MKKILAIPATTANLTAVLIIAICVLVAFRSFLAGTVALNFMCYLVLLLSQAFNLWFGSKKYRPFLAYDFLSPYEKGIYKRFALYVRRPSLAFIFSTTLHWLRIGAVVWLLLALCQGIYVASIALALFVILSSSTISTMFPDLYFEDAAKRGNRGAAEMLHALRHVQDILVPDRERPNSSESARRVDSGLAALSELDPYVKKIQQACQLGWQKTAEVPEDGFGAKWTRRSTRFARGEDEVVLWHEDLTVTLVRALAPITFDEFGELESWLRGNLKNDELHDGNEEVLYLREIERFSIRHGQYTSFLEARALDTEFFMGFVTLYRAGYCAKENPLLVAGYLLETLWIYREDRAKAIRFLSGFANDIAHGSQDSSNHSE